MRYKGRTDSTQKDIVKGIRQLGYRVFVTSSSGAGFPDMVVVGHSGRVAMLFENKPEEGGKVTPDELSFLMQIVEPVYRIVSTPEQVIEIMRDIEAMIGTS